MESSIHVLYKIIHASYDKSDSLEAIIACYFVNLQSRFIPVKTIWRL